MLKISKYVQKSILAQTYLLNSVLLTSLQDELNKFEVSYAEALILAAIFFEEKDVTPGRLHTSLRLTKSFVSHSLRYLEKKKWIYRKSCEEDARSYRISITADGKKHVHKLIKTLDSFEDEVERRVTSREQQEFLNVTRQWTEAR